MPNGKTKSVVSTGPSDMSMWMLTQDTVVIISYCELLGQDLFPGLSSNPRTFYWRPCFLFCITVSYFKFYKETVLQKNIIFFYYTEMSMIYLDLSNLKS